MTLRLTLIRCPVEQGADRERTLTRGQITIGRAPDNDWVMQDQDRVLSKNHCIVEKRGAAFVVVDTSTNGVFLNRASEPVGRGNAAVLSSGDQIRFGEFLLGVSLEGEATRPVPVGAPDRHDAGSGASGLGAGGLSVGGLGAAALPPIDENDPFELPSGPRRALGALHSQDEDEGPLLPGPDRSWETAPDTWGDGSNPDHAPAETLAMPVVAAKSGSVIPDDWDDAGDAGSSDRPPAFAPVAAAEAVPAAGAVPAAAIPDDWDDLLDPPLLDPHSDTPVAPVAADLPSAAPLAGSALTESPADDDPAPDAAPDVPRPAAPEPARNRLLVRDSFIASLVIPGPDEADSDEEKERAQAIAVAFAPSVTPISPAGQAAAEAAPHLMAITRALATALLSLERGRQSRLVGRGVDVVRLAPPADVFSTSLDGVEVVERLLALGPAVTAEAVRKFLEAMLSEPADAPPPSPRPAGSDLPGLDLPGLDLPGSDLDAW